MRDKNEILNYEEKAKVLRENGWDTYYHDDNWIKIKWIAEGKRYDVMGYETDDVYKSIMDKLEFEKFQEEQFLNNK